MEWVENTHKKYINYTLQYKIKNIVENFGSLRDLGILRK